MGFDAFVRCKCWQEGKTKPYPFDYGFYFESNGDLAIGKPEDSFDHQKWMAVRRWMEDCCEHPYMEVATVHVANRSGMTAFKEALGQIGWEQFPTLYAELPVVNGGTTSSEKADAILLELNQFIKLTSSTKTAVLIHTETGDIVQAYVASDEGVFLHDPDADVELGIDPHGFFVSKRYQMHEPANNFSLSRDTQPLRLDLFRATRLELRLIVNDRSSATEFVNLDTGKALVLHSVHHGDTPEEIKRRSLFNLLEIMHFEKPSNQITAEGTQKRVYHVEIRARDPHEFDFTIKALFDLCKAAKETGNPICWA